MFKTLHVNISINCFLETQLSRLMSTLSTSLSLLFLTHGRSEVTGFGLDVQVHNLQNSGQALGLGSREKKIISDQSFNTKRPKPD